LQREQHCAAHTAVVINKVIRSLPSFLQELKEFLSNSEEQGPIDLATLKWSAIDKDEEIFGPDFLHDVKHVSHDYLECLSTKPDAAFYLPDNVRTPPESFLGILTFVKICFLRVMF
jgi:hypothetical protein